MAQQEAVGEAIQQVGQGGAFRRVPRHVGHKLRSFVANVCLQLNYVSGIFIFEYYI